jgi:predicted amino acid racemase
MGELSALAVSVEAQFGITLSTVSAGNSANLEWLRATEHVGRIDDLRLGESILLGRDPLHGTPISGLRHDAATIVAEVIESKYKPRHAWGDRAQTPFTPPAVATPDDEHCGWQSLLGIGHQDTDPLDLTAPPGMQIIGASSDHLVITSADRLRLGSEVPFRPGYSALVRSMSSRYLQPIIRGGNCA